MEGVGEKWGELAIPCSFRKFLKLKKKGTIAILFVSAWLFMT